MNTLTNRKTDREGPGVGSFHDSTWGFTVTKLERDIHIETWHKKKCYSLAPSLISIKSMFQVCFNLV